MNCFTRKINWACLKKFSSGGPEAFLLRNHRYNHYQRGFLDLLKDKGKELNIAGLQTFFNHNYNYVICMIHTKKETNFLLPYQNKSIVLFFDRDRKKGMTTLQKYFKIPLRFVFVVGGWNGIHGVSFDRIICRQFSILNLTIILL